MSKPANKKVIGVFVLGAIALLVMALVIFGSGKIFKKTIPVVFYFQGSVKGLNIGSAVVLRGVQVGSVTNVVIQFNPQDLSLRIPVYAEMDPEKIERISGEMVPSRERPAMLKRLIDHGLRGQLETQSILTGLLMINLNFLPKTPVRLVGTDTKQLEIPTVPTTLEALSEKLQKLPFEEIFNKLASAVSGIDKTINSPEVAGGTKNLAETLEEVKKLVRSIKQEVKPLSASLQETIKDTRNVLKNANGQITGTASRLEALMGDTQKLVQNVDRQVEPLASGVEGTLEATRKLVSEVNGEVSPVASHLKKTLEEARVAVVQAQKTLQAAEGNYAEGSAFYYELTEALSGLNEASRSISLLGEYLKRHPDSVLWGKPGGR
jgi:paraquat-inducible protein B